jgi:hypothetical protein
VADGGDPPPNINLDLNVQNLGVVLNDAQYRGLIKMGGYMSWLSTRVCDVILASPCLCDVTMSL